VRGVPEAQEKQLKKIHQEKNTLKERKKTSKQRTKKKPEKKHKMLL